MTLSSAHWARSAAVCLPGAFDQIFGAFVAYRVCDFTIARFIILVYKYTKFVAAIGSNGTLVWP